MAAFKNLKHFFRRIGIDLQERFGDFESFNGGFIIVPWALGFLYYANCPTILQLWPDAMCSLNGGYLYAYNSVGIVLLVWGLRKLFVNRIKQATRIDALIERRRKLESKTYERP